MDDNSLLALHRRLLKLRRQLPVITRGQLEKIDTGNGFVLGLHRWLDDQQAFVFVNFADSEQSISLSTPDATHVLAATIPEVTLHDGRLVLPGYGGALVGLGHY